MVLSREQVGHVAFARLARDGIIREAVGGVALPRDVIASRAIRLHLIGCFVPSHTWLTGLAALWLDGLAAAPPVLDLAGPRGMHRTAPLPGSAPLAFHSGPLLGLPEMRTPRVATPTRACLDALAHSPASAAMPATASAVRAGATTWEGLRDALSLIDPHIAARARVSRLLDLLG